MRITTKPWTVAGAATALVAFHANSVAASVGGPDAAAASPIITYDDVPANRIGELETSIGFYQAIELAENSLLFSKQSKYQDIEVHKSKFYGKILVLDGVIQVTERDADSYNEMMAHIPMFQHPNPKRVLIVGGGDGYVLKEVLKHHSVEHVDHVDLDEDVIHTCEEYFPQWGDAWKDPRAFLHICDGAQFVRDAADGTYDVIIQDSSDPFVVGEDGTMTTLPSAALYEEDHICQLHRILKPNGILNIQGESFNVPTSLGGIISWRRNMEACGFKRTRYGSIMTSSYPTGQIGLLLGEKEPSLSADYASVSRRYREMISNEKKTTYYHPPLQKGCFELPLWAHENIYGSEDTSDLLCDNWQTIDTKDS
ncbi:spermidine synthase [Nitzschia inconspicua]|uniref:Spermidine synthase n=1 Tax=Nitzschia inconspicua TaxID=303405 RepID=A0A9K3PK96_9STRA|nr:spermidine synthase [Nitzschia inconspicua]